MVRRYGVPILRINMVTAITVFFTRQLNGQILIFDIQIKRCCENEQIAQGNFWYTVSILCPQKLWFVFIAPDKV